MTGGINLVECLTKFQFLAFPHHQRPPLFDHLVEEHEWYSDDDQSTLGVLFRDKVDDDWAYVVMQPGATSLFECVAVNVSFEEKDIAQRDLLSDIERISSELREGGGTDVRANLRRSATPNDPFVPIVPVSRLNPSFTTVMKLGAYSPARGMIREVFSSYVDRDGNFVEQFQTTGFDSRIWELYLHAYLLDSGFNIHSSISPDFVVSRGSVILGIEAVTANPTQTPDSQPMVNTPLGRILTSQSDVIFPDLDEPFAYKQHDFVPIKLGSALYSKLKKRYWENPKITGLPLIFAIETFHDETSLHYSSSALSTYLYGYRHSYIWDSNGNLVIVPEKVTSHTFAGKRIPSGFFHLPHSEHVSAVLFSNSGTISKFSRMGQQGAFRNPNIEIFRVGTCHNPDPSAAEPSKFKYRVGDPEFEEWWGQGLEMFHNPNALHPIDPETFPEIVHHWFEESKVYTVGPGFLPFASVTINRTSLPIFE